MRLVLPFIFVILFCNIAYSGQAVVSWNPNSESNCAGYKVYYGYSSRSYFQVKEYGEDAGNQTSYTISNLVEGELYFFAATAYDFSGNETGYSYEVSYNIPIYSEPIPDVDTPVDSKVKKNKRGYGRGGKYK